MFHWDVVDKPSTTPVHAGDSVAALPHEGALSIGLPTLNHSYEVFIVWRYHKLSDE